MLRRLMLRQGLAGSVLPLSLVALGLYGCLIPTAVAQATTSGITQYSLYRHFFGSVVFLRDNADKNARNGLTNSTWWVSA
jgi:hypothetical protein